MKHFPSVDSLTPEQFEKQVRAWLEAEKRDLEEFTATHQDVLQGSDGDYAIDVTARFTAFGGARFLVLIECKKHKNPIKREVVQVLSQKQLSVGAQKAIVVSTSNFQAGAIEFAANHGVALIQVVSGQFRYIQANATKTMRPIPESADDFVGFFYGPQERGWRPVLELVSSDLTSALTHYLESV